MCIPDRSIRVTCVLWKLWTFRNSILGNHQRNWPTLEEHPWFLSNDGGAQHPSLKTYNFKKAPGGFLEYPVLRQIEHVPRSIEAAIEAAAIFASSCFNWGLVKCREWKPSVSLLVYSRGDTMGYTIFRYRKMDIESAEMVKSHWNLVIWPGKESLGIVWS